MSSEQLAEDFQSLVDTIAGTADVQAVLQSLTEFAAVMLSTATGEQIECAVTLHRRRRTATISGSSETAIALDRIEQTLGDGPCVDALENGVPVILSDVHQDQRWPEYQLALAAAGIESALGVPMDLAHESGAVLNFFAPRPRVFDDDVVASASRFAEMASKALRLAIRLAASDQRGQDLKSAMENRTVIDLACGMIMAQNRCSQDDAFNILRRASSDRNQKLHLVALSVVERLTGTKNPISHFDG